MLKLKLFLSFSFLIFSAVTLTIHAQEKIFVDATEKRHYNIDNPNYIVNAFGVFAKEKYSYITDIERGLVIVDVSNPENPTEIGFCPTNGYAFDVYVSGQYAYVADGYNGLRIIDISNPSQPVEIGSYDTESSAADVFIKDNYAYVPDQVDGLRIIDITDPKNPEEVGYYITDGVCHSVYVRENYAYVGYGTVGGFRVVDVSDPTNPVEAGYCETNAATYGLSISGNYAYVAVAERGLMIIDINDPEDLTEISIINFGFKSYDVAVSGNYAYIAESYENVAGGLRIVDITDPYHPTTVKLYLNLYSPARSVYIEGDYVYVAHKWAGLQIFPKDPFVDVDNDNLPKEFSLGQNYPNPFNPTTTISYVIPNNLSRQTNDLLVQLKVYDALGHEIKTLVNEKQSPGEYSIKFDVNSVSERLSSGVYFYRLQAGNFIETKKMMLVK